MPNALTQEDTLIAAILEIYPYPDKIRSFKSGQITAVSIGHDYEALLIEAYYYLYYHQARFGISGLHKRHEQIRSDAGEQRVVYNFTFKPIEGDGKNE